MGPTDWELTQHGLQSTLACCSLRNWQQLVHRAGADISRSPHSHWAVLCPCSKQHDSDEAAALGDALQSLGFKPDASLGRKLNHGLQRGRDGSDVRLRGHWKLWVRNPPPKVPELAAVDLQPATEEEVSAHEKKVREAAKWEPIHLCPSAFGDLNFPLQVQEWVTHGVRIPYRGERGHYQEVPQYPWKSPELMEAAATEADRMLACGALIRPPEGQQITLVSPWVVVVKGGKTRCCLGLHELLNPCVASVPFSLPQFRHSCRRAKFTYVHTPQVQSELPGGAANRVAFATASSALPSLALPETVLSG